jgi:hypothetical protein
VGEGEEEREVMMGAKEERHLAVLLVREFYLIMPRSLHSVTYLQSRRHLERVNKCYLHHST